MVVLQKSRILWTISFTDNLSFLLLLKQTNILLLHPIQSKGERKAYSYKMFSGSSYLVSSMSGNLLRGFVIRSSTDDRNHTIYSMRVNRSVT